MSRRSSPTTGPATETTETVRPRLVRLLRLLPAATGLAVVAWGLGTVATSAAAPHQSTAQSTAQSTGAQFSAADEPAPTGPGANLFALHCSSCHGADATGIDGRAPDLTVEGRAAVDFVLRTGRMPMADPGMEAKRGPVRFSDDEITALVDYVGALGDGPDIPVVQTVSADLVNGGDLYRLNCAACHVASGSGAPIGGNREAPSLMKATPTEIGEAILVGPGAMPQFPTFSDTDINDVAGYVGKLQSDRTNAGDALGGAGPVAEGLAAWLLALLPIVAFTRWIGTPISSRDRAIDDDLGGDGSTDEGGST